MPLQPIYQSRAYCPVSKFLFNHQLALPMFVGLTEPEQDHVVETLALELGAGR